MKKVLTLLLFALLVALIGCAKRATIPPITEWSTYQDPYFKVSFSHPKGWHIVSDAGKVSFFSSEGSVQKFFDPSSKAEEGAQIVVSYQRLDTMKSLEEYVNELKSDLTSSGYVLKGVDPATIDETPASRVSYSGKFDQQTRLEAQRVVAIKDTVIYTATFAAFNDYYAPYAAVVDSFIATAHLPKTKVVLSTEELTVPSAEFDTFSNAILEISYPNNFETSVPQTKGEVLFSLIIQGYRKDSNIMVDVRPAKGLTVEKVLDQNSKFFKPTSKGESTIDGLRAPYLNYSLAKGTESRAYFLVKNDKVYRVILNYYQPAKKDFLPAFEKSIASLHIK